MTVVSNYGVHWAPGRVAFLMQARAGGANAVGLREPSPFSVKTPRKWTCNHLISLTALNCTRRHLVKFEEVLSKNALVRFMLPIPGVPGVGVLFSKNPEDDILPLTNLMKMSSPVRLPLFWANTASVSTLIAELSMTNVQPMILAGVEVEHLSMVRDLIREASTAQRKLLIVAKTDVPLQGAIDGNHFLDQEDVEMGVLPWETLGAMVLRAHMRQEWDGNWFTREPTPGDEAKVKLG